MHRVPRREWNAINHISHVLVCVGVVQNLHNPTRKQTGRGKAGGREGGTEGGREGESGAGREGWRVERRLGGQENDIVGRRD